MFCFEIKVTKHASNLQSVDSVSFRLRQGYAATGRRFWGNYDSAASKDVSNWQATQNHAFKVLFFAGWQPKMKHRLQEESL